MENNKNRQIAILFWQKNNLQYVNDLIDALGSYDIIVYCKNNYSELLKDKNVKVTEIPDNINTVVKFKNFVINDSKSKGVEWLHLIEDSIKILKNPDDMINDIENIMNVLDLNSWLCTVTDLCNFVYSKYNPRINLKIDIEEFQKFNINELVFCSHSNTQWMIFNLVKADESELKFSEDFQIAMFYIIEYLARRKTAHPDSLYFMNQYITAQSEQGVFANCAMNDSDNDLINQKNLLSEEDSKFKQLNLNYSPDNNIDIIIEKVFNKLKSKV